MRPAQYSILSILLKRIGCPVQSGRGSSVATPMSMVDVECKGGLNASRALFVLEYIIKKDRVPVSLELQYPTTTRMVGLSARMV